MRAWMFPGQGSQFAGMGRRLLAEFSLAREILSEASQRIGLDLDRLRVTGPASKLARPEVAEPLLAAIQIAYASLLMESGVMPDVIAGYSAGEVGAYFAAGVLSQGDALQAAVIRGRVLSQYTDESARMIAVARLPTDTIETVISQQFNSVEIAGRNAPDHHTLVGDQLTIAACVIELAKQGGTISDVEVAGPWHSRKLRQASEELSRQFSTLTFNTPNVELYTSLSGSIEQDPSRLSQCLADQVSQSILWQDIIKQWHDRGVRQFIEVGAGRVLMGLLRRNCTNFSGYQVECVESASGSVTALRRLLEASSLRNH